MGNIQSALCAFQNMLDYTYYFTIAHQKQLHDVILTFHKEDFRHCVGFQYLKDIEIPRNPDKLFSKIINNEITDAFLEKSSFYKKIQNNYAKVDRRIFGLQFLEQYLDGKNLVFRYVKYMNKYSSIDADYLIRSTVNYVTAHIFIRQRKNTNEYCICSFFIDSEINYNGIKAYWMIKTKMNNATKEVTVLLDKTKKSEDKQDHVSNKA